jgi:hypothetical protein
MERSSGNIHSVMPAQSRPRNGIASLAYVRGQPRLYGSTSKQDVDGRDEPGHDDRQKCGAAQPLE